MRQDLFIEINVTYDRTGRRLVCSQEWVNVYWTKKAANVRWIFRGEMPAGAVTATLESLDAVPKKYKQVAGFINRLPFRGVGTLPPSGETAIPDLIAHGNRKIQGYFCYNILLLDAEGNVLVEADPGGTNDPDMPPSPRP